MTEFVAAFKKIFWVLEAKKKIGGRKKLLMQTRSLENKTSPPETFKRRSTANQDVQIEISRRVLF